MRQDGKRAKAFSNEFFCFKVDTCCEPAFAFYLTLKSGGGSHMNFYGRNKRKFACDLGPVYKEGG